MILEIGCGNKKVYPNSVCLDILRTPITDIVWDLEEPPLPFHDNRFDLVHASHVLEHIRNLNGLMKDLHRILKPGGKLIIRVPFYSSWNAFTDPNHVRFFSLNTMSYYSNWFYVKKARIVFGGKESPARSVNCLMNPMINRFPKIYMRFLAWIIPAEELQFELINTNNY